MSWLINRYDEEEQPEIEKKRITQQKSPSLASMGLSPDIYAQDLTINKIEESRAKIMVIGVGGAGNNAVNRLFNEGLKGAETIAVNTDADHLASVQAHKRVLIGRETCRGHGAGNDPKVGEKAAEESVDDLKELIDADLVFITCGLGGGTGSGAGPVVARAAKESGALTVVICTLPFVMEGPVRFENARQALQKMFDAADAVIIIPNERLLEFSEDITMLSAFRIADEVLIRAVRAITELITEPQFINLDLADVKSVLSGGHVALIGMGQSDDQNDKVSEAVRAALNNPLLSDIDISSSQKALICVLGGESMQLRDVNRVVNLISQQIDKNAEIIWGASIKPELHNAIRVISIISYAKSNLTDGPAMSPYYSRELMLNELIPPDPFDTTDMTTEEAIGLNAAKAIRQNDQRRKTQRPSSQRVAHINNNKFSVTRKSKNNEKKGKFFNIF